MARIFQTMSATGSGSILGTPVDPASPGGSQIDLASEVTGTLPAGSLPPMVEDEFVATNGQTAFVLSQAPTDANSIALLVNGVHYDDGVDFTVIGANVTWTDTAFVLANGDLVVVRYK